MKNNNYSDELLNINIHQNNDKNIYVEQSRMKIKKIIDVNNLNPHIETNITLCNLIYDNEYTVHNDVICNYVKKIHVLLHPPDSWKYNYIVTPLSPIDHNNQCLFSIDIASIPKNHFIINNNKTATVSLYVIDKLPKVLLIQFLFINTEYQEYCDGYIIGSRVIY
jgi:hypothetical protein